MPNPNPKIYAIFYATTGIPFDEAYEAIFGRYPKKSVSFDEFYPLMK